MLCSFRLVLEGKAGKEITHTVKKCVSFFHFEKSANFRKMSISEGYFMQLKPNFSMWSV